MLILTPVSSEQAEETVNKRIALCHPDRQHLAKGFCCACYEKQRKSPHNWKEGDKGKRATCHPDKRNFSKGLCKPCHHKKYLTDNPDKKRLYYLTQRKRWYGYMLKQKFGMTVEQYDVLYDSQGGTCAICKKPGNGNRRMSVDHNHGTNKIRGLLCQRCNTIVGMSFENSGILMATISYLDGYKD